MNAKPILFLKSRVDGYTRRDGTYVKPHDRKDGAHAASGQLTLFAAPAKKPLPPNPFKGKDPVKSTPDLFGDRAEHAPVSDGIEIVPGKGLIKDKFLASTDGTSVPGGPWDTPEAAMSAARAYRVTLEQRRAEADEKAARKRRIADRIRAGSEPTEADLNFIGLRPRSSDLRWFIPAAADLFGISSRAVRPHISSMIRVGHTDMGSKREFVTPEKALVAIAAALKS